MQKNGIWTIKALHKKKYKNYLFSKFCLNILKDMQIYTIFANWFIIKQLKFLLAGNISHTFIAWLFRTAGGQIDFLPEKSF